MNNEMIQNEDNLQIPIAQPIKIQLEESPEEFRSNLSEMRDFEDEIGEITDLPEKISS